MKKSRTREITINSMFTALLIVCSWLSVPNMVPFSLQTFGLFITLLLAGKKRSIIAVAVYMLLGILGIPVFSGGKAGISILLGQTGGYIIGFFPCVIVGGTILERTKRRPVDILISLTAGLMCVYVFGSLWFSAVYVPQVGEWGFWTAIITCVLPFVIPDLLKIALAIFVAGRISKAIDFKL